MARSSSWTLTPMGQKPGLSRLETAGASQAGREGLAAGGPSKWPPKETSDSYSGRLLLPEHGH